MKVILKLIQVSSIMWATAVLPKGYAYVPWIVASAWGLTMYFIGRDDEEKSRTVYDAIRFVKDNGYEVQKCHANHTGKWIAFRKPGLEPIQHGVIVKDRISHYLVKRKNGRTDLVSVYAVIKFFDNKTDCYNMR